MGDVADILGISATKASADETARMVLGDKPKPSNHGTAGDKIKKPKGMSRELFRLLNKDSLMSAIQTTNVKYHTSSLFKSKRATGVRGRWLWAPINSSARAPGDASVYHWVKADFLQNDYSYAKFSVKLDALAYTDAEYEELLKSEQWSRVETDYVVALCTQYELRWPVIADRYNITPIKCLEDIRQRYYFVVNALRSSRQDNAADNSNIHANSNNNAAMRHSSIASDGTVALSLPGQHTAVSQLRGGNDTGEDVYNLEVERRRRFQQELHFRRLKPTSIEDQASNGKHERGAAMGEVAVFIDVPSTRLAASQIVLEEDDEGAEETEVTGEASVTAPTSGRKFLAPGQPCLQSDRLLVDERSLGLSSGLVQKVNVLLRDLGAPEYPVPTKAVCDLYDEVRQNAVVLASLQSTLAKRSVYLEGFRQTIAAAGIVAPDLPQEGLEAALNHSSTSAKKTAQRKRSLKVADGESKDIEDVSVDVVASSDTNEKAKAKRPRKNDTQVVDLTNDEETMETA